MTRRITQFISLALFLPMIAFGQDQAVDELVSTLRQDWQDGNLDTLTPNVRQSLIQRFQVEAGGAFNPEGGTRVPHFILLRLGEPATTRQMVDWVRSDLLKGNTGWPFLDILERSSQPIIIPMIAPDFFRNDGDEMKARANRDVVYLVRPLSIEMARLALNVLTRREHAFPTETRRWAHESLDHTEFSPPVRTRAIMQQWWRENESYFGKGRYELVQPGENFGSARAAQPEDVRITHPSSSPAQPALASARPAAASPRAGSSQAPAFPEKRRTPDWMWWAGGLVVMIVAVLMTLKHRAGKQKHTKP